ncbi:MAG: aldo/keto reductase [Micromonosporaceae bacterium]
MRSRRVGGTAVTTLGYGAAQLGNLYAAVDDETAAGAVDAAWEAGIRYFDTAPHYGLGLSERRLGAALAGRPRNEFTVSTKVGRLLVPTPERAGQTDDSFDVPAAYRREWDFSADGVRRCIDSSLTRLGLDRVDIVLLHDPDEHWEQAVCQAYPALHELRSQGVIGAIGAGMNQWQMLERFVTETDIDVVMLAGRYTLLEQTAQQTMLPRCRERDVSLLAAGVFNSGLLATESPPVDANYNYAPAPTALHAKAVRIAEVCETHGVTLPQAAIGFVAAHPAIASVVLGARSAEQVTRNAELFAAGVPPELWSDLVSADLLPSDALVRTVR